MLLSVRCQAACRAALAVSHLALSCLVVSCRVVSVRGAHARYVSFEDLMSLLNDVHKTNPGSIEKALRDADIARIGQVSDHSTGQESTLQARCCFFSRGRTAGTRRIEIDTNPAIPFPPMTRRHTTQHGRHQFSYSDFLDLDRRFPKMFYPVANLQVCEGVYPKRGQMRLQVCNGFGLHRGLAHRAVVVHPPFPATAVASL